MFVIIVTIAIVSDNIDVTWVCLELFFLGHYSLLSLEIHAAA